MTANYSILEIKIKELEQFNEQVTWEIVKDKEIYDIRALMNFVQ